MVAPTRTKFYPNLNVAPFVDQGNPTPANSLHGTLDATILDGIDDYKTTVAETPFSASSGSQHSLAFPVKSSADANSYVSMYDGSDQTNAVFRALLTGGPVEKIHAQFYSAAGDSIRRTSQDVFAIMADGNVHLVHITVSGNTLKIYIDKNEVAYDQTTVIGAGFTGVKSGALTPLSIGAYNNGELFLDGRIDPLWFFKGKTLTQQEIDDDYDVWFTAPVVGGGRKRRGRLMPHLY